MSEDVYSCVSHVLTEHISGPTSPPGSGVGTEEVRVFVDHNSAGVPPLLRKSRNLSVEHPPPHLAPHSDGNLSLALPL